MAGIGVVCMYKLHYWIERKFKIDDAVGAVAVHGYAGFIGLVLAGIVLWGHPASYGDRTVVITPWGQFAGAIIMFWVLGFLPAFVLCKILAAFDMLRIPKQIELIGLDLAEYEGRYLSEEEVR